LKKKYYPLHQSPKLETSDLRKLFTDLSAGALKQGRKFISWLSHAVGFGNAAGS